MDRKGPNLNTLRGLAGMLPTFAKGVVERKVSGKGAKVAPSKRPTKTCPVCFAAWDWQPIGVELGDEFATSSQVCSRCDGILKEGYIAIVCGGEYAFVKHDHLIDMAGTIQRVKPETFEKLRGKFKVQRQADTPPGDS